MAQAVAKKKVELQPWEVVPSQACRDGAAPQVVLDTHEFRFCERLSEHRCLKCNRFARTTESLKALRAKRCEPTDLARAMATRYFALTPEIYRHASRAVDVAV
eukprot:9416971-Pyramimonas_sp.AAC.1